MNTLPFASLEKESPRMALLASMVKSIYPDYVIERKPYAMESFRIHVEHSMKLVMLIGRP